MKKIFIFLLLGFANIAFSDDFISEKKLLAIYIDNDLTVDILHKNVSIPFEFKNIGIKEPADFSFKVVAGMPGHGHGMPSNPFVVKNSNNEFVISGLTFTMPGDWVINLLVFSGEKEIDRVVVPLHIKL